ncbi:MAG TPA: hypothetical protein VJ249_11230 [Candidatus Bathyarchaeia archaeon]|nr:hypothetical protein [Candidatus Bathyarchaeia archaeon]
MKSPYLTVGLIAVVVFFMISSVKAAPDPFANLRVIPVGSTETGAARITYTPADLMIYVTTARHSPTKNVWLVIVLNTPTFNALDYITAIGVDTSVTFDKDRFVLAAEPRIPPEAPDGPYDSTYPGCTYDDQYAIGGVKDQLGAAGQDVYYAYKFFKDSVTLTPYEFRLTLNFASAIDVSQIKALVLANGRSIPDNNGNYYGLPFDIKTPYSGSTLVVPELAPLFLALSFFTAFGLYAIKRKK